MTCPHCTPPDDYAELMGEADEVDVFFWLGSGDMVVRVTGLPEREMAWVH